MNGGLNDLVHLYTLLFSFNVTDSELHAQKDQERKQLVDLRNNADTTIYSIEKTVAEYKDKVPAEVVCQTETAVADLRTTMAGDKIDEIIAKLDAANTAVWGT